MRFFGIGSSKISPNSNGDFAKQTSTTPKKLGFFARIENKLFPTNKNNPTLINVQSQMSFIDVPTQPSEDNHGQHLPSLLSRTISTVTSPSTGVNPLTPPSNQSAQRKTPKNPQKQNSIISDHSSILNGKQTIDRSNSSTDIQETITTQHFTNIATQPRVDAPGKNLKSFLSALFSTKPSAPSTSIGVNPLDHSSQRPSETRANSRTGESEFLNFSGKLPLEEINHPLNIEVTIAHIIEISAAEAQKHHLARRGSTTSTNTYRSRSNSLGSSRYSLASIIPNNSTPTPPEELITHLQNLLKDGLSFNTGGVRSLSAMMENLPLKTLLALEQNLQGLNRLYGTTLEEKPLSGVTLQSGEKNLGSELRDLTKLITAKLDQIAGNGSLLTIKNFYQEAIKITNTQTNRDKEIYTRLKQLLTEPLEKDKRKLSQSVIDKIQNETYGLLGLTSSLDKAYKEYQKIATVANLNSLKDQELSSLISAMYISRELIQELEQTIKTDEWMYMLQGDNNSLSTPSQNPSRPNSLLNTYAEIISNLAQTFAPSGITAESFLQLITTYTRGTKFSSGFDQKQLTNITSENPLYLIKNAIEKGLQGKQTPISDSSSSNSLSSEEKSPRPPETP